MVRHSGQFERIGKLFTTASEAGQAIGVHVTETPRANCRVEAEGDHGSEKAGSIRLHDDGLGGSVFNERLRLCAVWRVDAGKPLTREERRQRNAEWQTRKNEKAESERREAREGSITARQIFSKCREVNAHPYLTRKKIKPNQNLFSVDAETVNRVLADRGVKNEKGEPYRLGLKGALLVAPLIRGGELASLQFIDANGQKRFMKTGRVSSAYWLSSTLDVYQKAEVIGIAEGIATALSVEQVKGFPCIASMSSGNLKNVARYWRDKLPDTRFLILSDVGNGEQDAVEASKAIGAIFVKPTITPEIIRRFKAITGGEKPTDFNDFYIAMGEL